MALKSLTLIPLNDSTELGKSVIFPHTLSSLHLIDPPDDVFKHLWEDDQWKALSKLLPLPPHMHLVMSKDDKAPRLTRTDDKDKELTFVYVKELKKLRWIEDGPQRWSTRAAWEYIRALPDDVPVILWWS